MARQMVATDLALLTISASASAVRLGDRVEPQTLVGRDPRTGKAVHAGVSGQIQAVHFSPADHTLVVVIKIEEGRGESWVASDLVAFRVEASDCPLTAGQQISPETILGRDPVRGAPVAAGLHGRVEAITFSGADHVLVVLVRRRTPELDGDCPPSVVLAIEAGRSSLRIGDMVSPETVVGTDLQSHEPLKAGVAGRVQSVHFDGARHALVVTIQPEGPDAAGLEQG